MYTGQYAKHFFKYAQKMVNKMQYTLWIKKKEINFFWITICTRYNKHTYPKQTTSLPYTVKLLHLQSFIYVKMAFEKQPWR